MKVLNIKKMEEVKSALNNLGINNIKEEFKDGFWVLKFMTKKNYIEIDNSADQDNFVNLKYYARHDSSYMACIQVEVDFLEGFLRRQVNY